MPIRHTVEDDRERFRVTVYETDSSPSGVMAAVHAHTGPGLSVLMIRTPVTEDALTELRGSAESGIVTSATVYDTLVEAICEAGHGRYVP